MDLLPRKMEKERRMGNKAEEEEPPMGKTTRTNNLRVSRKLRTKKALCNRRAPLQTEIVETSIIRLTVKTAARREGSLRRIQF